MTTAPTSPEAAARLAALNAECDRLHRETVALYDAAEYDQTLDGKTAINMQIARLEDQHRAAAAEIDRLLRQDGKL